MNRILVTVVLLFLTLSISAQDKPLRILEQPNPTLPNDYGVLDVQGTVRLYVQFLADGNIGEIKIVSSLPVGNLNEFAIQAAKKIKFEPQIKDGNLVNTNLLIEYPYSWKGGWKRRSVTIASLSDEKAEAILKKAVQSMGCDKYLK